MENQRPKVGVCVLIVKNSEFLMGKRKGSHGEGTWAPPGGHLEFGESIEDCARREVMEETGLNIKNIRKVTFTNDILLEENKHYVTCTVLAEYDSGELVIKEPHKCERWEWFSVSDFPEPMFIPVQNLLKEIDITTLLN